MQPRRTLSTFSLHNTHMSIQKRALLDGQYVLGVAASPDASIIAVHASQPDAKIHLFDRSLVKTGTRVHCEQGTSILKYARLPALGGQASRLLSAGLDGRLVVWDARSPREVLACEPLQSNTLRC